MTMTLIDPDDGVVVEPVRRRHFILFPLLITVGVALAALLWPPQEYDVAPLVKPPVATAGVPVPQTIVTVAQGQPVGAEAYWEGFRLNSGWHLAPTGDYGRYTLVAKVTNTSDVPDSARVLVTIRVADRNSNILMCNVSLDSGETKALSCADTSNRTYTSRWSRITISAL